MARLTVAFNLYHVNRLGTLHWTDARGSARYGLGNINWTREEISQGARTPDRKMDIFELFIDRNAPGFRNVGPENGRSDVLLVGAL